MDDGREMGVVEIVEMAGKAGGERRKMQVDLFAAARHRRDLGDAQFVSCSEDRVDAGVARRADRGADDIDQGTPGFLCDRNRQRTLRQCEKAVRECGGDGTH